MPVFAVEFLRVGLAAIKNNPHGFQIVKVVFLKRKKKNPSHFICNNIKISKPFNLSASVTQYIIRAPLV